jgi:hypothetical protein
MKKSSSSSSGISTQIVVRNNAPNWPAMVEKRSRDNENRNINVTCAASSLWMKSRQFKKDFEASKSQPQLPRLEKFASKTFLIRQCTQCQVLYTSFHQCISPEETCFAPSKSENETNLETENQLNNTKQK